MEISKLLSCNAYFLYNKHLSKILGPEEAILIGLFCSKYDYYDKENTLTEIDGEKFFYCTRETIYNETGLKVDRQRTAMRTLIENNILVVKRVGIPSKNYYKLQFEQILKLFNTTTSVETVPPVEPKTVPLEEGKQFLSNNNTSILSKDRIEVINKEEKTLVGETPTTELESTKNISSLENFRKTHIMNSKHKNGDTINQSVNEVIDYLNKVTGSNYRSTTPNTIKLIVSRLKEGYTVDDMKKVIDHRWKLWKGTQWEQYVRPNTLFRPSKFEEYLNSLGTKRVPNSDNRDALNKFGVDNSTVYNSVEGNNEDSGVTF